MKKLTILLGVVLSMGVAITVAQSEGVERANVLIAELSTGREVSASAEYVEIYNPHFESIDVEGWKVEYKSAQGSSWQSKAVLEGHIAPRSRMLTASSQNLFDFEYHEMSSGLSGTSGHIRIVNKLGVVEDKLAWGSANDPEGEAIIKHSSSESLKRLVNEDGYFIDTDNNFVDFFVSVRPSPYQDFIATQTDETETDDQIADDEEEDNEEEPGEPNEEDEQDEEIEVEAPTSPEQNSGPFVKLQISELFVDPDTPQTDAEDEYIEIYNPSAKTVDLNGYLLQSGTEWRYSHTFETGQIKPKSYLAIRTLSTGVLLSNSGSQVRLVDPGLEQIDGVEYESSKAGQSLSRFGSEWLWTEIVTPSSANEQATQQTETEASASSSTSSNTSSSTSKPEVAGKKLSIVAAGNQTETNAASSSDREVFQVEEDEKVSSLNSQVLVGVGSLALLYAGYEYRQDITTWRHKLGRYFESRRANRSKS